MFHMFSLFSFLQSISERTFCKKHPKTTEITTPTLIQEITVSLLLAGHGRTWPAMAGHGWPWPAMAGHGRTWPDMPFDMPQTWPDMPPDMPP